MRPQFIAGTVFISLAAASLAAEENASKPTPAPRSHIQPVGEIAAQASPPWAGLTTSRAPAVLRRQLAMERGAGLIVEEVAIGSTAEKAGLQQHDVLVSLDDQLLVVPEQLLTLLEESGRDAPLVCRVIRDGRQTEVSLRLRPVAPQSPHGRAALKPAASVLAMVPTKTALSTGPAKPARMTATTGTVRQLSDGSLLQRDSDYSVHLTGGDEKRLVVKDARSRIIFNDAIETPEQWSQIPTAVRSRVQTLERMLVQRVVQTVITEESSEPTPAAKIGALDIQPITVR